MSGSPTQQADSNVTNPFPTPADSAYGPSTTTESDATLERKDKKEEAQNHYSSESRDQMEVDDGAEGSSAVQSAHSAEKVTSDDSKLASDKVSLEQIQKDMGEAFLLCRTSMAP